MTKHATNLPATLLDRPRVRDDRARVRQVRRPDQAPAKFDTATCGSGCGCWFNDGQMPLRRLIELTADKEAALDADCRAARHRRGNYQRREELPQLLTSYLICHPKPRRGRGRRETDTWLRDQCIAVCVAIARERWRR